MTTFVRLRRQARTGTEEINLYRGTSDYLGSQARYDIRYGSWKQGRTRQNEDGTWEPVTETMDLRIKGQSRASLALAINAIDRILKRANEYTNRTSGRTSEVWLQVWMEERQLRQALVYHGHAEPQGNLMDVVTRNKNTIINYSLGLLRHPFWEPIIGWDIFPDSSSTNIHLIGGVAKFGPIEGDVQGRAAQFAFMPPPTYANSGAIAEFWAGFRTYEYGAPHLFEPNWDCGDAQATMGANTARVLSISGALHSQVARWTPGDTSMLARVTVRMSDITGSTTEQNGTYIVLLRMRPTSGATRTFHVRMASGYYDSSETSSKWRVGERVLVPASGVSAGSFYYYPMGTIDIPADRVNIGDYTTANFALRAEAQVAQAGTGNLEFDTFTLIPVAEGGIYIGDAYAAYVDGNNFYYEAIVRTGPDDETIAYNRSNSTTYQQSLKFNLYNWGIPPGDGFVVIAGQESDRSQYQDRVRLDCTYHPRYITLRG